MNNTNDWIDRKLEPLISTPKPKKATLKSLIFSKLELIESALGQGYTYDDIAFRLNEANREAYPDSSEKLIHIAVSTLRKYTYLARKAQAHKLPAQSPHRSSSNSQTSLFD